MSLDTAVSVYLDYPTSDEYQLTLATARSLSELSLIGKQLIFLSVCQSHFEMDH